jgi:hypothetical protein
MVDFPCYCEGGLWELNAWVVLHWCLFSRWFGKFEMAYHRSLESLDDNSFFRNMDVYGVFKPFPVVLGIRCWCAVADRLVCTGL